MSTPFFSGSSSNNVTLVPPVITQRGATITTGAASGIAAIPKMANGSFPTRVRLSSTAAAYARFGTSSEVSAAIAAAGTVYAPGNVATLAGGTFSDVALLTVTNTKVVSATVGTAGSGGTDGAGVIVEGTTGTGTKFRASVTVTSGAIASVQSITVAGDYTVNPTVIAQEPVTLITGGAGLTGAKLAVVMGVLTVAVTNPGVYTVYPSNPVAQDGPTNPAGGTGATFTMTFVTAAAAGDVLVNPEESVILDATGFDRVAAIQVAGAGVLQVSPIET